MKAVFQKKWGGNDVLEEGSIDKPEPTGRQLLVQVKAVATNPVDIKKREGFGNPAAPMDIDPRVLGWDASGVVVAVGPEASLFKVNDEVFFAGDISKNGTFAEFVVVDECIVGVKPKSLTHTQASAFPLVSITGWEVLTDIFGLVPGEDNSKKSLLIINGAGGVGSITTQLAKKIFNVGTVITTASRPESIEWTKKMGADQVVNHREPLKDQLPGEIDLIFCCVDLDLYTTQLPDIIKSKGRIASITFADSKLDLGPFFFKSVTVGLEVMFTRPLMGGEEALKQKALLDTVSKALDDKTVEPINTQEFKGLSLATIRDALAAQGSGKGTGKIVIDFQ